MCSLFLSILMACKPTHSAIGPPYSQLLKFSISRTLFIFIYCFSRVVRLIFWQEQLTAFYQIFWCLKFVKFYLTFIQCFYGTGFFFAKKIMSFIQFFLVLTNSIEEHRKKSSNKSPQYNLQPKVHFNALNSYFFFYRRD